jgi:tetratricopeptide (TPR) repeat protein
MDAAVSRSDYESAVAHLHEVIDIYQQLNMKEEEANAWGALAALYLAIGGDDNARAALDRGRELAQRSGYRNAMAMIDAVARLQALMARDAPLEELEKIYAEMCKLSGVACTNETYPCVADGQQAVLVLQSGRFEEGRNLLRQVLKQPCSHDLRALFHAGIGGSYVYQRNAPDAIDAFIQAVEELELATEAVGGEEMIDIIRSSSPRKMYAEVLVELLAGQGRIEEALSYAERARSRAFLQMIGNRRINPRDERLASEIEALRTASRKRTPAELQTARLRYRELLARV